MTHEKPVTCLAPLARVGVSVSWTRTYTHTLAISVDMLTASVFWNKSDLTVSSLCGLALRVSPNGKSFLCRLGRGLNRIDTGHCEAAITADAARMVAGLQTLSKLIVQPNGTYYLRLP